jgi:hypothetical protein
LIYSENDLWGKLQDFDLYKYADKPIPVVKINKHTNYFKKFFTSINMSLILYPKILKAKNKDDYNKFDYYFYCNMSLVSLITSLETYLENNFRAIAAESLVKDLNTEILVDFVKKFNIKPNYFEILKKYDAFKLSKILPSRMDFQQKDKAKIAYKLIDIDLKTIADKNCKIWESIFKKDNGYIDLRNNIIHVDIIKNDISNPMRINEELIYRASIDIAEFVFKLDKSISNEYPSPQYTDFYGTSAW